MVALDERVFSELCRAAESRNITVQELLRAIVVPEWMRQYHKIRPAIGDYGKHE